MAIATPQNAISSAASTSVSFALLPTAGSSIVVHVSQYRSGAVPTQPTIADNQGVGNVYTLAPSATATLTSGTDNWRVSIFVCKVIGATSGTFTITETATDGDRTLVCEEYTGTDTVNTVNISGNASAAAASTSISKLLASTVANCYGTAAMTGSNAANPFSMTPANETANLVREEENNSTAQAICVGNGAVVAIGNHTGGFTHAASASVMAYVLLAPAIAGTAAVIMPAITLPNRFVGPLVLRQYSKDFYFDTTQAPLKNTEFILPSYPLK
jgi:hypothetical protein